MAKDSQEHLQVLRNAIQMELEGKDFFERAIERVQQKRAREMFEGLAKQEQRHIEILGREFERLSSGKSWLSLEEAGEMPSGLPSESVFKEAAIRRIRLAQDAGELEVLKLGIEVERRSIEYYSSARERSANREAKEILTWLVSEESGHLTILNAEYEHRRGSGYYYDEPEFSLEVM